MQNQLLNPNDSLENLSLEEIDALDTTKIEEVVTTVESNTNWSDTSKHMTMNGAKMNC